MTYIIVTVLHASPVNFVSLQHLFSAVIACCNAPFGSMYFNVIVSWASVRVEIVPLWAAHTDSFLVFFSQVTFFMKQFLKSGQAVMGRPMRVPDVCLTLRAFFSDHIASFSMLIYLSLLIIGSTITFNYSKCASLLVIFLFVIRKNFSTSLISASKLCRVQDLMSKTMNLIEADIFAS